MEGTLSYRMDSNNLGDLLKSEQRHGERNKGSSGLWQGVTPSRGDAKALVQVAILVSLRDSSSSLSSLSCSFLCGKNNNTAMKDSL